MTKYSPFNDNLLINMEAILSEMTKKRLISSSYIVFDYVKP